MKKLLLACIVLLGSISAVSAQDSRKVKSSTAKATPLTPAEAKAHNASVRQQKKAIQAAKYSTAISKATTVAAEKPKKAN